LPGGQKKALSGAKKRIRFYTDQELDTSTNLYNYDARLYDPVVGRFISPDSIVPDYFNPQSLNRYSYCLNNPLIYVDPTGHYANDPGEDPPDSGLGEDKEESKGDTVETNSDGLEGLNEDPFEVAGLIDWFKSFIKLGVKTGVKGNAPLAGDAIKAINMIGDYPKETIRGGKLIQRSPDIFDLYEKQRKAGGLNLDSFEQLKQRHSDSNVIK